MYNPISAKRLLKLVSDKRLRLD